MQAILTKYIGPNATKGTRIKATCAAGTLTISWDYGLSDEKNHAAAARQLQLKIAHTGGDHWLAPLATGCLPDGSYAHVFKD